MLPNGKLNLFVMELLHLPKAANEILPSSPRGWQGRYWSIMVWPSFPTQSGPDWLLSALDEEAHPSPPGMEHLPEYSGLFCSLPWWEEGMEGGQQCVVGGVTNNPRKRWVMKVVLLLPGLYLF